MGIVSVPASIIEQYCTVTLAVNVMVVLGLLQLPAKDNFMGG